MERWPDDQRNRNHKHSQNLFESSKKEPKGSRGQEYINKKECSMCHLIMEGVEKIIKVTTEGQLKP